MSLFAIATVAATLAATPIRLEEVRELARNATPAQLAELDRQRQGELVRQARAGLFPQVAVTSSAGYQVQGRQRFIEPVQVSPGVFEEEVIDIAGSQRPSFSLGVQVNQTIYDPALLANLRAAGAQFDAQSFQAAEEKLAAELEGIRRFFELLKAQKAAAVVAARVKNSEEFAERAEALFQAGRRRKEDAISARINLGNDRTALVRQQFSVAQTSANLALYIHRPAEELLLAQDPANAISSAPVPTFEEARKQAREHRPLLRSLEALTRAAKETVSLAQAAYLPAFGASFSYNKSSPFPSVFVDPFFNNTFSGGVGLRWDVFNGFNTNARVREAAFTEKKALVQLEQAKRDLESDLVYRIEAVRVAGEVTRIAEENFKLAEDNLTLATSKFEQGAGTTLEIRDAQQKHTDAQLLVIQSRIELELARAALERAMGAFAPGAAP